MDEKILVSILCATYNHEKNIAYALDGFISQKTNFKYEVIVHDDASTDNTAKIISLYQKKYPDIVRPIFETENQFCKHDGSIRRAFCEKARGTFFAICEGDDYWVDQYKIQKQVDSLLKNVNVGICASSGYKLFPNGKLSRVIFCENETIIGVDDVISAQSIYFTASLVFRREYYEREYRFKKYLNNDYSLEIAASLDSGMLMIPDCTCVYRCLTNDGWTDRMRKEPDKLIKHLQNKIEMLNILDDETNEKYHKSIVNTIYRIEYTIIEIKKDYKKLLNKKYRFIRKEKKFFEILKVYVKAFIYLFK